MEEDKQNPTLPLRIASLVHAHFDALPKRSKPAVYPDGSRDWIPMSGIVIAKGLNTAFESLTCVAVTTGAKCLSASQIPRCRGLVLHDCHAEILAIRAFNYWLLEECRSVLAREQFSGFPHRERTPENNNSNDSGALTSPFVQRRREARVGKPSLPSSWPPFELQPDIKIYMYCTCAPCGDASMELCMAAQEDATPWEIAPDPAKIDITEKHNNNNTATPNLLDGRAHFSLLGVVRRKPARVDAESTRSKSCSDKLALRQVSSLFSYETSLLVAPTENAYLEGLILPEDEISRVACERSSGGSGRMKALNGRVWPLPAAPEDETKEETGEEEKGNNTNKKKNKVLGYRFRPFKTLSVPTEQTQKLWQFGKPKNTSTISSSAPVPQKTAVQTQTQKPENSDISPITPNTTPSIVNKRSKPGNVSVIWVVAPSFHSEPDRSSVRPPENGSKSLPKLWMSKTGLYENLINGVKQGNRASEPLARGASCLSRAKLWKLLCDIVQVLDSSFCELGSVIGGREECYGVDRVVNPERGSFLDIPLLSRISRASTYDEFKRHAGIWAGSVRAREEAMNDAKSALKGWIPNAEDDQWGLDVLIDPKRRKGLSLKDATDEATLLKGE